MRLRQSSTLLGLEDDKVSWIAERCMQAFDEGMNVGEPLLSPRRSVERSRFGM
jgi:hypothetical protein